MRRVPGRAVAALAVLAALGAAGRGGGNVTRASAAGEAGAASWNALSSRRVYFGHMSVGFNIVAGLEDLRREFPGPGPRIVESSDPEALAAPGFAHGRNGRNHDPLSKIAAFTAAVDGGLGGVADTALFKFCFVDVTRDTDAAALFGSYREAMEGLRRRHPATRFVHVTVPLTVVERGWKARVKKMLGRPPDHYLDNIRRHEFNRMLRLEYGGREPIFDLAAAESRGGEVTFTWRGSAYPCLAPDLTSDGGHLNAAGRRAAALALVGTLAAVEVRP